MYKNSSKKGVRINLNQKIPEGQEHVPRLDPTAPIRLADRNQAHYPSRQRTILKKRRLDDGLPAHAIRSTRESSEDVTRTLDAPPSKVRSDIFPTPKGQPVRWLRAPPSKELNQDVYKLKEEGSQNKLKLKNPRRARARAETRTCGTDSPIYIYIYIYISRIEQGIEADKR